MKAPIAATALLSVLLSTAAIAAPGVEEVAKLIAAKLACPARDAADGFVLSTETDNAGKYPSKSVVTVDRKAHRMLTRTRLWNPADPTVFKFNAFAFADGVAYGCSATKEETCTLGPLPVPTPLNAQRDITSRYMSFRDFLTPEHGGAELALEENDDAVEGAAWTLRVTPKDGLPVIMHAGVDGTMKAMDIVYPDASFFRTLYTDRKGFEDCETAGTMRQTSHPKDTGYVQTTVISIETRQTMTAADTPVDQLVTSP